MDIILGAGGIPQMLPENFQILKYLIWWYHRQVTVFLKELLFLQFLRYTCDCYVTVVDCTIRIS